MEEAYFEEASGIDGSPIQYQKAFLNFVDDLDIGVSLFKMNPNDLNDPDNLETWDKITLDSNSLTGIKKEPCNN